MIRLLLLLAALLIQLAAGRRQTNPGKATARSRPIPADAPTPADGDRPWWTVIPLNAPQAVKGTKAKLLRWPARGRKLRDLLIQYGVTLAGLQEIGPRYAPAFRGVKRFLFYLADPNNVRGAWEVGNGIIADAVALQRLHTRTKRIRRRATRTSWVPGWLKIPVHLYRDRDTGDRVIFVAGHADRKRPNPTANLSVLEQIAQVAAALHHATGVPVLVAMDTNNEAAVEIFKRYGLVQLASSGIDKVFGIGVRGVNERVLRGFAHVVTDHDDPPAVDVTPMIRNFDATQIPKLGKLERIAA